MSRSCAFTVADCLVCDKFTDMNSAGTQEATERLTGLGLAYLGNMSVDDMLEATAYIGAPLSTRAGGPLVDLLRPHDRHSKGATFSDLYGFGAFPWHTDGAVDPYPPKYPTALWEKLPKALPRYASNGIKRAMSGSLTIRVSCMLVRISSALVVCLKGSVSGEWSATMEL